MVLLVSLVWLCLHFSHMQPAICNRRAQSLRWKISSHKSKCFNSSRSLELLSRFSTHAVPRSTKCHSFCSPPLVGRSIMDKYEPYLVHCLVTLKNVPRFNFYHGAPENLKDQSSPSYLLRPSPPVKLSMKGSFSGRLSSPYFRLRSQ